MALSFRSPSLPAADEGVVNPSVFVHVYDVGPWLGAVNTALRALGSGAFHVSVEVYGDEWAFVGSPDADPGVTGLRRYLVPVQHARRRHREAVFLGYTKLTPQDVLWLMSRYSDAWQAAEYHMVRRNCVHFAERFLRDLGVQPLPTWVQTLSEAGRVLHESAVSTWRAVTGAEVPTGPSETDRGDSLGRRVRVRARRRTMEKALRDLRGLPHRPTARRDSRSDCSSCEFAEEHVPDIEARPSVASRQLLPSHPVLRLRRSSHPGRSCRAATTEVLAQCAFGETASPLSSASQPTGGGA